jgi:hypothetical protein
MGIAWCFGWEIITITNEEAAWCYVITNMNNQIIRSNQNAPILVHRCQIKVKQSRSTCLILLLPGVVFDRSYTQLRLDARLITGLRASEMTTRMSVNRKFGNNRFKELFLNILHSPSLKHWPWSLNLLFYRRGFGLVVSGVVVPSMLAVLPYARGRGFDSRSRLLKHWPYIFRILY